MCRTLQIENHKLRIFSLNLEIWQSNSDILKPLMIGNLLSLLQLSNTTIITSCYSYLQFKKMGSHIFVKKIINKFQEQVEVEVEVLKTRVM